MGWSHQIKGWISFQKLEICPLTTLLVSQTSIETLTRPRGTFEFSLTQGTLPEIRKIYEIRD